MCRRPSHSSASRACVAHADEWGFRVSAWRMDAIRGAHGPRTQVAGFNESALGVMVTLPRPLPAQPRDAIDLLDRAKGALVVWLMTLTSWRMPDADN